MRRDHSGGCCRVAGRRLRASPARGSGSLCRPQRVPPRPRPAASARRPALILLLSDRPMLHLDTRSWESDADCPWPARHRRRAQRPRSDGRIEKNPHRITQRAVDRRSADDSPRRQGSSSQSCWLARSIPAAARRRIARRCRSTAARTASRTTAPAAPRASDGVHFGNDHIGDFNVHSHVCIDNT